LHLLGLISLSSISFALCICFCASTMLFLLLWLCSIIWNWVLWYFQCWSFLFRITLTIWGLLCFCMNFRIFGEEWHKSFDGDCTDFCILLC
jgi:hypothetical protein